MQSSNGHTERTSLSLERMHHAMPGLVTVPFSSKVESPENAPHNTDAYCCSMSLMYFDDDTSNVFVNATLTEGGDDEHGEVHGFYRKPFAADRQHYSPSWKHIKASRNSKRDFDWPDGLESLLEWIKNHAEKWGVELQDKIDDLSFDNAKELWDELRHYWKWSKHCFESMKDLEECKGEVGDAIADAIIDVDPKFYRFGPKDFGERHQLVPPDLVNIPDADISCVDCKIQGAFEVSMTFNAKPRDGSNGHMSIKDRIEEASVHFAVKEDIDIQQQLGIKLKDAKQSLQCEMPIFPEEPPFVPTCSLVFGLDGGAYKPKNAKFQIGEGAEPEKEGGKTDGRGKTAQKVSTR